MRWRREMAYIHARLIVPLETCIPVFERVSRSRAWKKWKGHFSWRNFLFLSVIFLSLLSSSDFFFSPFIIPEVRSIRDNVYRGIVHVGRFYRVVFGKYEGESEVEGNILCSSGGVSDERDVGQRCARRCGVKWILEDSGWTDKREKFRSAKMLKHMNRTGRPRVIVRKRKGRSLSRSWPGTPRPLSIVSNEVKTLVLIFNYLIIK